MKIDRAWKLLDSPEKFAKKAYARNKDGESVRATVTSACSWCTVGALRKVYGKGNDFLVPRYLEARYRLQQRIRTPAVYPDIVEWSDAHTWQEVHDCLKEWDI